MPIFSIGLLADIQYAPIPDGHSYSGVPRYYRHAREVARHAAKHFQQEKLPLVVNLGDIVDGKCQDVVAVVAARANKKKNDDDDDDSDNVVGVPQEEENAGHRALDDIIKELSHYNRGPILHAYGNHCLYNVDRPTLQEKLGIPFVQEPCGDWVGYYSFVVPPPSSSSSSQSNTSHNKVRLVVLDSYDVAKMKRCEQTSSKYKQADKILREKNPNYPTNENSPEGLEDLEKRFVAFNGAVGPLQLEWLQQELEDVRSKGERAIIVSHQPILPGSTNPVCLIWNYHDVLDVLRDFSDVIMCSFAGHAHKGGYMRDQQSGIHFRVFEAVLENQHPHKTYAIVDIHEDKVEVRGFGNCQSAEYALDHMNVPSSVQ